MSTTSQSFADLKSGEEMRAFLVGKAADDAEFRARLVADPKQVLNEEFGMPLPDAFELSIHEDSGTHVHLVLPPSDQLDLAALAEVGGGHYDGTIVNGAPYDCWDH